MAGTRYLIDGNILIRWVQPSDLDYPIVKSALEALANHGAILCYTSQNVAEFWNACTRPADRNGYGLLPQEADRRARLFETRLRLLADNLAVHQEWRRLIVTHSVSGVRIHDARLVAAMRVFGVKRILTFNERDFARYADIEAIHPSSISAMNP
jgi:predicted nucleic acid-binding protein